MSIIQRSKINLTKTMIVASWLLSPSRQLFLVADFHLHQPSKFRIFVPEPFENLLEVHFLIFLGQGISDHYRSQIDRL